MIRQHSSTAVSGVTVRIGLVMQSAAVSSSGFLSFATVRITISRSVTTPTGFLLSLFSTTGISPQSLSTIILATSGKRLSSVQHAGLAVITSFTCIAFEPPSLTYDIWQFEEKTTSGVPTDLQRFTWVQRQYRCGY